MTTVRAQCPACGDVQLQIDDLTVRVCSDDEIPARTGSGARLRPDRAPRGEPADRRPAGLRRCAPRDCGAGPPSSPSDRSGPPLTPDDLLDLHVLLEDDTWFDELVALVRRTTPE